MKLNIDPQAHRVINDALPTALPCNVPTVGIICLLCTSKRINSIIVCICYSSVCYRSLIPNKCDANEGCNPHDYTAQTAVELYLEFYEHR